MSEQVERCEHCGSDRIYHGPPDCPRCGAPNCCQMCCKITIQEKQIADLELALNCSQQTLRTTLERLGCGAKQTAGERTRCRQDEVQPLMDACRFLLLVAENIADCHCERDVNFKCLRCSGIDKMHRVITAVEKIQREKP